MKHYFEMKKKYIYVIQVNVDTYIKLERSNKDFVSKISFYIHDCTNLIIKKTFFLNMSLFISQNGN